MDTRVAIDARRHANRRSVSRLFGELSSGALAVWTLLAVTLVAGWTSTAAAQYYFGKNKVQYTDFNWLILSTKHFDIYFYETERSLAEITAASAEHSYNVLANRFNHHVGHRIPLIIYSSPRFFSQTNVVPSLLPENVGGFTEFFKGRVVLPFNGSYADFRRVLQHELTHVFTRSKLAEVSKAHRKMNVASPPLWFEEGTAEFFSRPWEPGADMILSDQVLSGHFGGMAQMEEASGTYLMYKEGESFCHFIEETRGAEYLVYILDNWWRGGDFEEVVRVTFGKTLADLGREWDYWLKKKYFPAIQTRELPDRVLQRLTRSGYNVKPVPVRLTVNGHTEDHVVYKGNRLGYTGLYMASADSDGADHHVVTLLKGERSPRFESLHLLGSSLDASADGRVIFSSTRHERDVLYLLDLAARRITGEYHWDSLYNITSPAFAPDGQRVVFAGGGQDGLFDLFLFDLATKTLKQLTHDDYLDTDPAFTPDGGAVVFASDRGGYGEDGWLNLFRYDLGSGQITPEQVGRFNVRGPSFSPDGRSMIFTSDRGGHADVYRQDSTGHIDQLTHLATGAFDPRYHPDGRRIVLSAYQSGSFQIFDMALPDSAVAPPVVAASEPADTASHLPRAVWAPTWKPIPGTGQLTRGAIKYQRTLSFDLAQSAVAYDAFYGTLGGFQTALTDILGNQQYYFLMANNATSRADFLKSFNIAVSYFNREHRLYYGYGAFHLFNAYDDPVDGPVEERQYGAVGHVGYPLSKFRRVEASLFLRESERDVLLGDNRRAILATQFLSLVHDNSLWDISGPIDGWRFMLALGYTGNLSDFRSLNRLAIIDARKYFRLRTYSAFATRVLGHFSTGTEPQRRYLGGSWDLRGYPRFGEYARNVVLWTNELRFPLINDLFVGFPVANLGFQAIRGALFFDAANAWENHFGRMQGAMGVGARVSLGYFVLLRFDWARRTDFRTIDNQTHFEFFFGWNF